MKAFIDLELISKLIKEISSSNYSPTTMSDLSPPPLERSSYATEAGIERPPEVLEQHDLPENPVEGEHDDVLKGVDEGP